MCQRKRFGVVLLLVAGLVALLSRPAPAQNVPSGWAAPGALGVDAGGQPRVIASTKTTPPPRMSDDSKLPPPDDGLSAPKAKDAVKGTPVPTAPAGISEIQQVGFVPQKSVETKRTSTPQKWEQAAQLAFLVLGPENAIPGQPVAYQILVKNRGAQLLAEVGVVLPIPTGARIVPTDPEAQRQNDSLSWKLGNMEPKQERVVRFEVQSTQPGEVHLRPRATFGPGTGLTTSVVRPPFSLSVTGPEGAAVGETVVFNVQVGNHTSSPIANVNLRCELSEGLAHAQGREVMADLAEPLLPSQVRAIPLETQVRAPGRQQITVNATAIGGHRSQASWRVPVSEASLALVQRGPRQANVGELLTFRLEVRNPGRSAVGPVRLSQVLPEGVVFVSADTAGMFEVATQAIVWTLPSLQAGEMQAVTFAAQGRKPGDWAMPVSAGASGIAEARATHAVRVDSTPMASLTLKTQDDRLAIGGETVCEARLYNQGPNNMRDARLVVQIPEGLDVVNVEGPTKWQQRGKQVVFEPMGELRPRVDAIYRVRLRAVSGTNATIQAELNAAGMEKPQQAFRAIRIAGAAGGR